MTPQAERLRVLVADDHPLFREAVARAVRERPEFDLVLEVADGQQALDAIRELAPDVAVLDVKMPLLDGLQVLNAISREGLPTRTVLLTAFLEGPIAFDAVAGGAGAVLSKEADRAAIADAIAAVGRGDTVLAPEVQSGLAAEIRLRGKPNRPALSAREQEVLRHVADGRSAPEIAEALYLSPATVRSHLQSLYEKLDVSDRAAAVAEAMRRGLLE